MRLLHYNGCYVSVAYPTDRRRHYDYGLFVRLCVCGRHLRAFRARTEAFPNRLTVGLYY